MRARYTCTVKLARRTVLVIWALSAVMALPIIVGQDHYEVGEIRKGYWCTERWPLSWLYQVNQVYMLLVVYVLPLTFMTCTYVSICRRLWQVRYQRASIRAQHEACAYRDFRNIVRQAQPGARHKRTLQSEDATRKQVVKMLVAVVVLFALCWGPIIINNVLVAFGVLETLHVGYLKPMRQVFWLLAYLNSCLNPVVYGFMSKNFRESFRNTVWRCVLRKPPNKEPATGIYWRCSFQVKLTHAG
nr:hypothetical protein BaRGS_023301 [Batillaria attramentaria]